jgi:hypothetical protein
MSRAKGDFFHGNFTVDIVYSFHIALAEREREREVGGKGERERIIGDWCIE